MVVRILSHPAYNPRRLLQPHTVASLLKHFSSATDHAFWPDSVSILDHTKIDLRKILVPKQITDAYLLALAVTKNGRFITFDESIYRSSVHGATTDQVHVI